jgi:serine protease inhibitor
MVSRHLELEIPAFEAKSAIDLNETLIDLGLKDAFRDEAGQNSGTELVSDFRIVRTCNLFALES